MIMKPFDNVDKMIGPVANEGAWYIWSISTFKWFMWE